MLTEAERKDLQKRLNNCNREISEIRKELNILNDQKEAEFSWETKDKGKLDKKKFKQTEITVPKAIKRRIKVPNVISVAELAKRMGIKGGELIKKLMEIDIKVTLNQTVDFDSASLVAGEFGYELDSHSSVIRR